MKRFFLGLSLVVVLILSIPGAALAQEEEIPEGVEIIDVFNVRARLTPNRHLMLTETIVYDFDTQEKHGIYRYIPETFTRDGATYTYRFENIKVSRDGHAEPFSTKRSYGNINIKIGDANRTISGKHTYTITYETDRAITFFSDHSELYWNVTGNGWAVPIVMSSFTLNLDGASLVTPPRLACFTGEYGSTEAACTATSTVNSVSFKSRRLLHGYEGLTVVMGFPPETIHAPTSQEKIAMLAADNLIFGLPVLAFIIMFGLWWKYGRDPKIGTIIPEYEPPEKMTPAEVAGIWENGALSHHAVTATIIDLARRGYLRIRYEQPTETFKKLFHQQDYAFINQKKDEELATLNEVEKMLFTGLFPSGREESKMKDLEGHFHASVRIAEEKLWEEFKTKRFFNMRPGEFRGKLIMVFIFSAIVLFVFWLIEAPLLHGVAVFLTLCIVSAFAWFMPNRTQKGVDLYARIKGFEWFLSVTEKDRLEFHNAPKRTPEQFQALLPFAIALGVEKAWAKQFEDMVLPPPEWAEGTVPHGWTSSMGYISGLHSFHSQASSSGYAAPASSGRGGSGFSGGGSGGGGGGGGGGSW